MYSFAAMVNEQSLGVLPFGLPDCPLRHGLPGDFLVLLSG